MIRTLFFLLGLGCGVLVTVAGQGFSGELLLEYGQCRFGAAPNGTYYDQKYGSANYLTPQCASIGYADTIGARVLGMQLGYRVALIQSGSVEARDNLAENNDGIYSPHPCSQEHLENCHSIVGGIGRMRGVSASLTATKTRGHWHLTPEVGLLFFEHHFNGYARPANYSASHLVDQPNSRFTGTPDRLEGFGLQQESSIVNNPIPLVGLTVRYRQVYFAVRHHFPIGREGLSVTDHSFTQITGGVAIQL